MATKAATAATSETAPAAPAAPAPAAPAAPAEDPFAAAFQLMAKNEDDELAAAAVAAATAATDKAAAAAPPAAAEEAPAAAQPAAAEEAPAAAASAAGEEAPAGESPVAAEKPAAPAQDGDVLARLAKLVKGAPAEEPERPAAPAAPPQQPELFTAEEKQLLDTYEKDWPDVARAETLRRRSEYQQLVGFIFNEVAKEVKPIIDVVRTLSERTHLSDLTQAAPDYEQMRENVIEWVKTQPTYLRSAYDHVISQGTADEVADLIGRYKQATGQPAGSPKPAAPPVPAKAESELPPATKKAVASLAPVSSKRSAVVQPTDPSDFEGAFAAFAKEQNS